MHAYEWDALIPVASKGMGQGGWGPFTWSLCAEQWEKHRDMRSGRCNPGTLSSSFIELCPIPLGPVPCVLVFMETLLSALANSGHETGI